MLISRKKSTAQKHNTESFGITLNNLNQGSTEKKKQETNPNIRVTDFIAGQQKNDEQYSQRGSVIKESGDISDLTSIKHPSDTKN